MREIRDPGTPIPDIVPPELIAVYGDVARRTVKRRRSLRFRVGQRLRKVCKTEDLRVAALVLVLWGVVAGSLGAALALSLVRWPRPALYVFVPTAAACLGMVAGYALSRRARGERPD
jgi:hypothetical protein